MSDLLPRKDAFYLEDGLVYLNGNSLGPMSKASEAMLNQTIQKDWKQGLVRSWSAADWISLSDKTGARIAPLIGAGPDTVMVADTVSVNIFKLASAALHLRKDRSVILTEEGSFPTDGYILDGLAAQTGTTVRRVKRDNILSSIDDDTACVLITHVHYVHGDLFDLDALSRQAHHHGALTIVDLSHTVGAIPVDMTGSGTDFAVGCGYKYLNGGPGAPGFAFVSDQYKDQLWQPLSGWMGHAAPFAFDEFYKPADGVQRLKAGTPPIISLAALYGALEVFDGLSMNDVWARSRALSQRFQKGIEDANIEGFDLQSPKDPEIRGSHLSYAHKDGYGMIQAMIDLGVIGDFRAPHFLRFGFAPLYLDESDIDKAVETLIRVFTTQSYKDPKYLTKKSVT